MVTIYQSNFVEFVPTEMTQQFPKLNALVFWGSNLPVVKNDLLGPSLKNIQFLNFFKSNVESVEAEAFSSLVNLKYIYFDENPLKALKFPLFKNNRKLEIIRLRGNKIQMINPSLFDGLAKLKIVEFDRNVGCVRSREFGCETCQISLPELKTGLATCFSNCEKDLECNKKTSPKTEATTENPKVMKEEPKIQKNQSIENEEIEKSSQVQVQETLPSNLEVCIKSESNFLASLKSLTRANFETQNSLFENSTKLLANQIDQTITAFKSHFQETLANQNQEFTKFSETLEKSNQKTVESLSHSNKRTAESLNENFGTKIDLALVKMRNSMRESIAIVAGKVEATLKKLDESGRETREYFERKVEKIEESSQATRQALEKSNRKTVESMQNSIIKATDERLNRTVELVEAKLAKTEIALELEKSRVLLLERKVGSLEAQVKSLQEKLAAQAQAIDEKFSIQVAEFVGKQFDEFKEILRGEMNP